MEKLAGRIGNDWQLLPLAGESSAKRSKGTRGCGRIAMCGQTGPRLHLPTYPAVAVHAHAVQCSRTPIQERVHVYLHVRTAVTYE